jgi:hypothetical protein
VAATAAQGAVLPMIPPAPNSSWTLDFSGPSLSCANLEGALVDNIIQNVNGSVQGDFCTTSYGYIAWTPDDNGNLPFIVDNGTYTLRSGTLGSGGFQSGSRTIDDVATIYIATFPGMVNEDSTVLCNNIDEQLSNAAVIQCALFNTSYHAAFTFVNGAQTVNITRDTNYLNEVVPVTSFPSIGPLTASYPNGTKNPGTFNTTEVETLAYQSIMDSLGGVLVGSIADSQNSHGAILDINTTVMSTVLSDTIELHNLTLYPQAINGRPETLQQEVAIDPTDWNGISALDSATSTLLLRQALENLFQTIVVSLMTSAVFQ